MRERARGRQREGGDERDRLATPFFFLESQISRPVGSIPSHTYGMTTLIMGPSNALITCESAVLGDNADLSHNVAQHLADLPISLSLSPL